MMTDDMQEASKESCGGSHDLEFSALYFSVPGLLKNFIDRQLPMNSRLWKSRRGRRERRASVPIRYER
ncbi:MAG: hypothetical protein ACLURV_05980 [Gallintestinimicrobium sp.]